MKIRPILFSTEMVNALIDGRKKMTRRTKGLEVINEDPDEWKLSGTDKDFKDISTAFIMCNGDECSSFYCPYGDVLWVRESFYACNSDELKGKFFYKTDLETQGWDIKWKPSIHMPKSACRTWLRITDIRVQRLQDISEQDAVDEGILDMWSHLDNDLHAYKNYAVTKKEINEPCGHWNVVADNAIESFKSLWVSIHGAVHWDANPWVWVVSFDECGMPEGFLNEV